MTNVGFVERYNLIREGKMFVKDEAEILSRVGGVGEALCILACWFLSLMGKNSVFEELIVRRLAVVED